MVGRLELCRRHEALHTHFSSVNGIPMQVIGQAIPVPTALIDLSDKADNEERLQSICEEEVQRPFDLSADLMLRASLIRLTETDHAILAPADERARGDATTPTRATLPGSGWSIDHSAGKDSRPADKAGSQRAPTPWPRCCACRGSCTD